jgi:hypothetical protein
VRKPDSDLLLQVIAMDIEKDKRKCGNCEDWQGHREKGEKGCTRVKPSARGNCERLQKVKPPHGGCQYWEYCWDEQVG